MSVFFQDDQVTIDGRPLTLGMHPAEALIRAVIVSLFTWRRANADDPLPGADRFGWWGDNFAAVANDRIGSRLWLLAREKLTTQTVERAREYTEEALAWLIEDGVATRVDVEAERQGVDRIAVACRIYREGGSSAPLDIRFADVWSPIAHV